jgi:predicted dehydrogenase
MPDHSETSRRDFLATSIKMTAVAGLVTSAGCAATGGPALAAPTGPTPPPIKPDQKLRIGFIGTGGRGQAHVDSALMNPNITVKAVAEINEVNRNKALDKIKEKLNETPEVYSTPDGYKKLLAREDIDGVFLATPCDMHAPMYLDCFAAGKHFYGEKPLCLKANEANALVESQKKNPHVIGQIGFQRRASAKYQNAVDKIRGGIVGEPVDGRGAWNNVGGPIGLPKDGSRVWLGRRIHSGDWMLEQACHTWDVFNWVANAMPIRASGFGRRDLFKDIDPDRDVTDFYFAHLEYPNNFFVSYQHNWFCPPNDGALWSGVYERVMGTKGGLDLESGKFYPRDKKDPVTELPGSAEDTHKSIATFFECLRTGTKPPSGVENGRMATLTGLLVRKAVDEQRWVSMKEIL